MTLILQIWGGIFYLLNKALFALAEGRSEKSYRNFKVCGWFFYIIGVPAWVIILFGHNDWIAGSIEAGGIPAMFLGLYNAYHYNKRATGRAVNIFIRLCTYGSLVLGLGYSVIHNGGIVSLSQILEIGVMIGFLLGGYLLAKNNDSGWLFFMLMNLSMAGLMMVQGKSILMVQQLMSLSFVVYGFVQSRKS